MMYYMNVHNTYMYMCLLNNNFKNWLAEVQSYG